MQSPDVPEGKPVKRSATRKSSNPGQQGKLSPIHTKEELARLEGQPTSSYEGSVEETVQEPQQKKFLDCISGRNSLQLENVRQKTLRKRTTAAIRVPEPQAPSTSKSPSASSRLEPTRARDRTKGSYQPSISSTASAPSQLSSASRIPSKSYGVKKAVHPGPLSVSEPSHLVVTSSQRAASPAVPAAYPSGTLQPQFQQIQCGLQRASISVTSRKQEVMGNSTSHHISSYGVPQEVGPRRPTLPPEAMEAFSRALAEGQQCLRSVKLCFVGHARAGKTSTLLALAGRDFDPAQPSTHGVDTCSFAQEMLQATTAAAEPWSMHEGGSNMANVLDRGVARATTDHLRSAAASEEPTEAAGATPRTPSCPLPTPDMSKMPVDLMVRALDGDDDEEAEPVVMQTWDFAGQDMYYSMAHVFLTSLGVYVLCLDLSAWAGPWGTGEPPRDLVDSVDFWLAALMLHAPEAHLVIVGTHTDAIPDDERPGVHARVDGHLARHLERMPSLHRRLCVNEHDQLLFHPVDNSRGSLESQEGVDRLRAALNTLALQTADALGSIPTRWAHLFHLLDEEKAKRDKPCLSLEDCLEMCGPLGFCKDELEPCLQLFHGLGQLLHFPGSPAVVLDPQWLLDAMAHVVACPRVLQRHSHRARALRERGELSSDLLDVLWVAQRFLSHRETLQAFLEHFDLLVPGLADQQDGAGWLVPSLLPKRPAKQVTPARPEDAVFFLDFHGALRKLLPSLLLRLLGHLRGREGLRLRTFEAYRDYACFAMGQRPIWVSVEMLPAVAPEVVRFGIAGLPADDGTALTEVRAFLEAVTEALLAWIPRLSFSTKVPCPACCMLGSDATCQGGEVAGVRLLELSEVLAPEPLLCPRACMPVHEHLPPYLQHWRRLELGEPAVPAAEATTPSASAAALEESVCVDFLYASPLAWRQQVLDPLDVASEAQALRSLAGLRQTLSVATATALGEALAAGGPRSVLHLTAHCALYPHPLLLLEDEKGSAHAVDQEELASMGPWGREGLLLVFLACGSELLVRGLIERCGLRRAVCCAGEVFDSAARTFCRAFYHALCAGHPVEVSHSLAQAAVRGSANPGLRSEAGKFLLLGSGVGAGSEPWRQPGRPPEPPPHWPLWPPVEDYVPRVAETLRAASLFVHRRVLLLWGEDGLGKTAFCRELCRHFSAPGGRLFSAGAHWLQRGCLDREAPTGGRSEVLAQALLTELGVARGGESPTPPGGVWPALREAVRNLDQKGRWLLVVDGLRFEEETLAGETPLAEALDALLQISANARLLLTARRLPSGLKWTALADAKVNTMELAPLPPQQSARLFARRVRRPLFPRDLDLAAPGPEEPGGSKPLRLQEAGGGIGLLERLAASPLLHALGGIPGRLVRAAAMVDKDLPSLLQHPFLPRSWQPADSAEAWGRDPSSSELAGA